MYLLLDTSYQHMEQAFDACTLTRCLLSAAEGASEAIEVFKFPEEVIEAAEAAGNPLPFAVVGSRDTDDVEGDDMPLRHYPWGTCLPLRKEHSDAVFFRYLIQSDFTHLWVDLSLCGVGRMFIGMPPASNGSWAVSYHVTHCYVNVNSAQ